MRIRHKPWAKPELEACPFYIKEPEKTIGRWNDIFPHPERPLYVELGCGKGGFISQIAPEYPEINFIAIDIKNEMLVLAKRKLEAAYREKGMPTDNIRIAIQNIERIDMVWSETDKADRIYINFCNPWPKKKHKKHRLTHTRQLLNYKRFLRGEIWFKTDDDGLFEESLEYFKEAGYKIKFSTHDLHSETDIENFMTEHEKMFTEEGKKIKFLIAEPEKTEEKVLPEETVKEEVPESKKISSEETVAEKVSEEKKPETVKRITYGIGSERVAGVGSLDKAVVFAKSRKERKKDIMKIASKALFVVLFFVIKKIIRDRMK